jgi:hypothetical protein
VASTADVLLRLVISGQDPAEIRRLADQTYGVLKAEAAQHLDALGKLHREKDQAIDDATKKRIDGEIKAEQNKLKVLQQIMRQQEIETNRARASLDRWLERLENITTVSTGAWNVISSGFERFKGAAEEIIRTTQIYDALHGSIDAMREATEGEVADIDLIAAKNRGFQKDLKITDEQYGLAAAAAKRYADSIGGDVKEQLDGLIDGLATGRKRMLESVLGKIDDTAANEKWAKSMGTVVEAMTEENKLAALQAAALDKMAEKQTDVADGSDKLANRMERGFARLKNILTGFAVDIGNIDVSSAPIFDISVDPTGAVTGDIEGEQRKQAQDAASKAFRAKMQAKYDEEQAAFESSAGTDRFQAPMSEEEKKARQNMKYKKPSKKKGKPFDLDAYLASGVVAGNQQEALSPSNPDDVLEGLAGAAVANDNAGGNLTDKYIEDQEKAAAADEKRYIALQKAKGISIEAATAYEKMADSLGIETAALTEDERMQALEGDAKEKSAELADKLQKEADERRSQLKETGDKAGMLGVFLFGVDGPDETYKEMDLAMQHIVDTFGEASGMIQGSARQMSTALATAIGGALTHQAGWKSILHNQTHDILESLATQAGSRAIFEAASALAYAATGNFASASLAGASAIAFGGLAATAGIAAHALGTVPTGAAASAPGSGVSYSGNSSFSGASGYGGSSGSGGSSNDGPAPSIVFQINAPLGSKEEVGRAIEESVRAYEEKTGRKLLAA